MDRSKVENMEQRLKKDVMNELRIPSSGGNIVVHEEVTTHHVYNSVLVPLIC